MSGKTALILIAEGAEEAEFVITVDVLRRAGVNVVIANVSDNLNPVVCSRGVKICPEVLNSEVKDTTYDAVILPGGLGATKAFIASEAVGALLKKQYNDKRVVAAICAAPSALKAHAVGLQKKVTCHPSVKDTMQENSAYNVLADKVVVDDNLITSQGPGTAFDFALAIVEKLVGKETATTVSKALIL